MILRSFLEEGERLRASKRNSLYNLSKNVPPSASGWGGGRLRRPPLLLSALLLTLALSGAKAQVDEEGGASSAPSGSNYDT